MRGPVAPVKMNTQVSMQRSIEGLLLLRIVRMKTNYSASFPIAGQDMSNPCASVLVKSALSENLQMNSVPKLLKKGGLVANNT